MVGCKCFEIKYKQAAWKSPGERVITFFLNSSKRKLPEVIKSATSIADR